MLCRISQLLSLVNQVADPGAAGEAGVVLVLLLSSLFVVARRFLLLLFRFRQAKIIEVVL